MLERAAFALGFAGDADLAAVMDELVAELNPAGFWDDLFEILLDFHGVSVGRQFQTS